MDPHPILRRVGDQSHLFQVVTLELRFKLSGCSLLCFDDGVEPMLGEHCSASVYSPRELHYERLTCELAERSVTLHCDPEFFLRELGLTPDETPEPIRAFLTGQPIPREFKRIRLTAHMRRTLVELMQPTCLPQFTRAYRELKARDLALSALIELQGTETRVCDERSTAACPTAGLTAGLLLRATQWLHQNLSEDRDLQDLAAAVKVAPGRLLRAFKHTTGLTPQQYRLRARVERARQLLVDGQLPLKAIGQDSGFYDQAHLTRAFRAAYGTTPSRYRKERVSQLEVV
ncbi:MAG: helix-turn-helix transcriptional regulator [Proteobacteria bacterium]|nr:helix-turn-helix transcriptional regulator [Pseudomonadota bacterium]